MRRQINPAIKDGWKAELLAACKNPSGFPEIDRQNGCQYRYRSSEPPRECECLTLYSCMQRHADFGFNPDLFRHNIEDIILVDRGPLDRYLVDPERVWRENRGLYIWAEQIGVGKTTLAHLVVRHLYRWLHQHSYSNAPGGRFPLAASIHSDYLAWYLLAGDVSDRANYRGRDGFIETLANWSEGEERKIDILLANMLVIDELGRENRDDRRATAGREMLEQILRERRGIRAVTILVGHDPPGRIGERYGEHIESLMGNMSIVEVSDKNGDRRRPLGGAGEGW